MTEAATPTKGGRTMTYTDNQVARGRHILHRAEQWRRDCPEGWNYVVRVALGLARDGQPISGRGLVEAVRRKGFVDRRGNDSKVNNDFSPVFSRWLLVDYPQTAEHIEKRKTVFNELIA